MHKILFLICLFFLFSCGNNEEYISEKLKESRDLAERDQLDKAIIILNQLNTDYPDNIDVLLDLGTFKAMSGKYHESLNDFKKVIQIDPQNTLAYYNLGLSYANMNKHSNAVECFDE